MTNKAIIALECATRGITEECHTYAKWRQLGFIVKKGEKAKFSTQLWKVSQSKKEAEDENESGTKKQRCFLTKSFLFAQSQVERMEVK